MLAESLGLPLVAVPRSTRYGIIVFMDIATIFGLLIGFGGIIFGNLIEGGHMSSLMQVTAFLIVFAGTAGAVMVSSSEEALKTGVRLAKKAFTHEKSDAHKKLEDIVEYARLAKKDSLIALEPRINRIADPLMQDVLRNVVDGVDEALLRDIFETQIYTEEEELLSGAKIWSDAGGFSPTIGIIGAVLGLIHVMGNLTDTSKLGAGIAVAFVATIYGVSFANLVFIPLGNKIKRKVEDMTREKLMVLEGGILIAKGANHFIIEQKLRSYLPNVTKA
ncbi:flagellar motor protein [Bdellovibrio sp. HCB209]|uniref:flagellar motor protein n=1 Tax=Bdellovibrio sp. HCB209 TaxID=3394354 RepID=UPI0039B44FE8